MERDTQMFIAVGLLLVAMVIAAAIAFPCDDEDDR